MNLELDGKVCFVAGSSRGIGLAIARRLLAEGARAAISGRASEALRAAEAELSGEFGGERVLAIVGDIGAAGVAEAVVKEILERWNRLDVLVANVGSGRGRRGWDVGRRDWEASLDANLWPTIAVTRAALGAMTERGSGSILVIGSITGVEATPAPLAYSASKAALANYAVNLARQVGPSGVRVNYLAPGNIYFAGGTWERLRSEDAEAVERMLETEVPLGRFGTVEEIADAAAFLVSARAGFVTGAVVVADGGQTRGY